MTGSNLESAGNLLPRYGSVLYSRLFVTPSSSLGFGLIAGTLVHEHTHRNDKVRLLQRGPPRHPRGRSSGESE
eukprot:scaffold5171_cov55-Phaeocystis_antarctica.AAC.4